MKRRRSALGLPHPNSPASRMHDWSSADVPHPHSPAGKHFDSPVSPHTVNVPAMTLNQRFIEVLKLTPHHMGPELAAQFRAMLTPSSMAMIAGTLTAFAISQFFGIGEVADLLLLVGAFFSGMAAYTAAKDVFEFVKITVRAKTPADLDRAAGYLAQAVAIVGVVAFFALVAKIGAKFGKRAGIKKEGATETATAESAERTPPGPSSPHKAAVVQPEGSTSSAIESRVDTSVASNPINKLAPQGLPKSDGSAFKFYMEKAKSLDVSTKPNQAVFYSGRGNRPLAEAFARENGKVTLERTPGGAWLDSRRSMARLPKIVR